MRFVAAPYDHGFRAAVGREFDDLDEALIHAARHAADNGRVTSFTGRNVRDVTWRVQDTETGEFHAPRSEHLDAARVLGDAA